MPALDYNNYAYVDDKGQLHAIRLAASGAAAQPTAVPTGALTGIPVLSRRSSRQITLQVRGVRLQRTVGTAPNDKAFSTFLPILKKADWDALVKGATLAVAGVTYTIQKKLPEVNTGY